MAGDTGVFVLCNVPAGAAVRIIAEPPGGPAETTEVEIRAGKKGTGKVLVHYSSLDHLEQLLKRLR